MELKKKFKWSEVLSGFTASKSRKEKELAMMAGMPGHVPYESEMVREWQAPFLFYRFFIYGLVLTILIFLCSYLYGVGNAMLVGLVPFFIPLTILILIWELNIPHNISLPDSLYIMLLSGAVCYLVTGFMESMANVQGNGVSAFTGALLKEVGKLIMVCIFLRGKGRVYGMNGVLIGAAVGAGVAVFRAAEDIFYVAQYNGQMAGIMSAMIVRVLIMLGGEVLWPAAYGGALSLAKGKEPLQLKQLGNSLFLICFLGAYLMSVLWDYDITDFFARFADSSVAIAVYAFLYAYQGKYLLLTVAAWALLLYIARKGMEQAIEIADAVNLDKRRWEASLQTGLDQVEIYGAAGMHGGEKFTCDGQAVLFGRSGSCMVQYPDDTKGISGTHCEIKKQGEAYVLTDQKSTYGTYLKNGTKLLPGKPYELKDGDEFYLATPKNSFQVHIRSRQAEILKSGMDYGKRTNEGYGPEEESKSFYAACGVVIAAMFLGLYAFSNIDRMGIQTEDSQLKAEKDSQSITGAWTLAQEIDVKSIILDNIDNLLTTLDIGIFKNTYANGITFTQDGKAYMTYHGVSLDYAQFTYSQVDDTTIHLQWDYETPLGFSKIVTYKAGDKTGYDAAYSIEGGQMNINFFGYHLTCYR